MHNPSQIEHFFVHTFALLRMCFNVLYMRLKRNNLHFLSTDVSPEIMGSLAVPLEFYNNWTICVLEDTTVNLTCQIQHWSEPNRVHRISPPTLRRATAVSKVN